MDARNNEIPWIGLAPEADVWVLPREGVLSRFPDGLRVFPGDMASDFAAFVGIAPAAHDAVFSHLVRSHPAPSVVQELMVLHDRGLVTDVPWPHSGTGLSELDPATLATGGFSVWGDQTGGHARIDDVWIVPARLSALANMSLPSGRWVPVQADAEALVVGPLFTGGETAPCVTCLARAAGENDDLDRLLSATPGARAIQTARRTTAELADDIDFVHDAVRDLTTHPPGTIFLRRRDGEIPVRSLARPRGGCKVCNAPPDGLTTDISGTARVGYGGYRPVPAAILLPELERFVDPVVGIVRDLRPLPVGAPVQSAGHVLRARHAFPLAVPDLAGTLRNRQGRSAGKGRDETSIRVGAIAEAMERYAGVARPGDVQSVARPKDLAGPVILPEDWTLISREQQETAPAWNALDEPSARVPPPRGADDPLEWTRITSMHDDTPGWAPAALCWHQFAASAGCAAAGWADSNGCAAGQGRTDAQLQGLLELVERDAIGIWWWSRVRRPEIGIRSLDDPWANRVAEGLGQLGYDVSIRDLTHDLNVPVAAAVAWPHRDKGPLLLGFGAHPSRAVATSRALTELLQALPDRPARDIGGDPCDGLGRVPGAARPTVRDLDFLRPGTGPAAPGLAPRVPDPAEDAREARDRLLQRLSDLGLRAWCLDQSRPDVPLRVVRMIVPGLRHFRPRFAPGRLWSVPADLGWAGRGVPDNPCFIR